MTQYPQPSATAHVPWAVSPAWCHSKGSLAQLRHSPVSRGQLEHSVPILVPQHPRHSIPSPTLVPVSPACRDVPSGVTHRIQPRRCGRGSRAPCRTGSWLGCSSRWTRTGIPPARTPRRAPWWLQEVTARCQPRPRVPTRVPGPPVLTAVALVGAVAAVVLAVAAPELEGAVPVVTLELVGLAGRRGAWGARGGSAPQIPESL